MNEYCFCCLPKQINETKDQVFYVCFVLLVKTSFLLWVRNVGSDIVAIIDNITGMSEVEETLNRMQTHKNVQGIVIVNGEGAIIRSTYTNERKEEGNALARLVPQLIAKAKNTVRDLDSHNDLKFMRLKTTKYQILIAPDNEFILIVVQGQKSEGKEEEEV